MMKMLLIFIVGMFAFSSTFHKAHCNGIFRLVNENEEDGWWMKRTRRGVLSEDDVENRGTLVNSTEAWREERVNPNDTTVKDYHKYYNSTFIRNGKDYFIDLTDASSLDPALEVSDHKLLSKNYQLAASVPLKFQFPFYGNLVKRVVVTTAGFVNIGPIFHSYVHIVHYIAPLMADFNPSSSNNSKILYASGDDMFIVQWKDMIINGTEDNSAVKKFDFEMIMYSNGTIFLVYKHVPISPAEIKNTTYNVTVGVSDGFVLTYFIKIGKNRVYHNFIHNYHKVNFGLEMIQNNSVIRLDLLPSCVQMKNCSTCLDRSKTGAFKCRWCEKLKHCSDTYDWKRQRWQINGCNRAAIREVENCPVYPPSETQPVKIPKNKKNKSADKNLILKVTISLLCIVIVVSIVVFFYYAYKHPQSRSGMWLIENRPSRIFRREHMPVVLDDPLL